MAFLPGRWIVKYLDMQNTTGYIYFYIKTENESHNLSFFDNYLTIKPTNFSQIGEKGNTPFCTTWEFSSGELISPIYHIEVTKLVKKLKAHKDELLRIKNENEGAYKWFYKLLYI